MSQRIEYGPDRQGVIYYDVMIWWWAAFEIEDSSFDPAYIPQDLIEDMEQQQRLWICRALPDSDRWAQMVNFKFLSRWNLMD
jgi:hypothetical protein